MNIGNLALEGNLFLAPVAGYTDFAFRRLCAEQGADFSFTELVSTEALTRGNTQTSLLTRRGKEGQPYAIQLFGATPDTLYRAALLCAPLKPEALDLNAGCPVNKVVKTGAGAALMREPSRLAAAVAALRRASEAALGNAPITVKMRSGWDARSVNFLECAQAAVDAGAAMVTLHPRTRAQVYTGKSDWTQIAALASRLSVPVCGSGDLWEAKDAVRMLRETNCAAVMFARGAEGRPWLFAQTKALLRGEPWTEPDAATKLGFALRHLKLLAEAAGEKTACLEMRKQFCAYTKGMKNSAALRDKIVHAQTVEEYRKLCESVVI
jgi:nifR3 family TIM-barrel protein